MEEIHRDRMLRIEYVDVLHIVFPMIGDYAEKITGKITGRVEKGTAFAAFK